MPAFPSSLRRLFGTVSIGSIPTRHVAVLLYLVSTERKDREKSLKRLGGALGISENTVWAALRDAYRRGYLKPTEDAPPQDEPPGRDLCFVEVTPEGRKALRPFFNVVGLSGLVLFIAVSLLVGGLVGYLYGVSLSYLSQYTAFLVVLFAGIAVFYTFIVFQISRTARDLRRNQLFEMFNAIAEDRSTEE